MDDSNPRKRPRPVVSCLRCRDKKLKCDRTSPCENCVKAQTADACTYQRNPGPIFQSSQPVSTSTAVADLQSRLARVEELLGIQSSKPTQAQDGAEPQAIGTVVVKGSRSIFHGQNDRTTLLNQGRSADTPQFLEVKDCLDEISRDKQVQTSSAQIKFLQNKFRSKIGSPESNVGSDFSVALLKLREFLPPKPYCDRLVALYCQHFERTFRVLHVPTFLRRYNQVWSNDHADICTSSSIIPELTAVMTMAYHMDGTHQVGDDRNHRTYLKGSAMDFIQAWLNELGRKQRTELSTLQVDVLLLLSRSLRGLQPEQLWSSTGALVRSAMIMGLNVDPARVSGLTPYMAEMRRRLWATILEVDLQASLFCGMPLVIPDLNQSALVPSNINDAEINEVMDTLPIPYPKHTYTDCLYQVVLASSLPQRIKALSIIQQSTPNIEDGISLGRKMEDFLSEKPRAISLDEPSEASSDSGSLWHRVLLDLYLRRPILRLYKTLLLGHQKSSSNTPLRAELEKHCLESSQIVLSYQDAYTLSALATVTNSPWAHQNLFYNACKGDVLWAALTLCQEIKQSCGLDRSKSDQDSLSLVRSVETTIGYLINRIGQKGSDVKDIVFLALVLQSVQIPVSVPGRTETLQQTARKTLAVCREKLLQPLVVNEQVLVTLPSGKRPSIDATSTTTPISNGISQPVSNTPTLLGNSTFSLNVPASTEQWIGDFPDLAGEYHMFQDSMFDPNDPLNFGIAQNWNWEHMWQ